MKIHMQLCRLCSGDLLINGVSGGHLVGRVVMVIEGPGPKS